jgi:hypothetical protein
MRYYIELICFDRLRSGGLFHNCCAVFTVHVRHFLRIRVLQSSVGNYIEDTVANNLNSFLDVSYTWRNIP